MIYYYYYSIIVIITKQYIVQDKQMHIKHFKSLFEQNWLQSGSAKLEVVRSNLPQKLGNDWYKESMETKGITDRL